MITEKELQEAINECLTSKNPNANTCLKLAAFYTIKDHMTVRTEGESGILPHTDKAWSVMEELLDKLQIVNPNLYETTIGKLQNS